MALAWHPRDAWFEGTAEHGPSKRPGSAAPQLRRHQRFGPGTVPDTRATTRARTDFPYLETWQARLNGLGVVNGGVVDAAYGSGLSFRDPDNIALEFFAPPT